MTDIDYQRLAEEFLRALRGRRSRVKLSRTLRYRSNVIFDWETGRRAAKAAAALSLAEAVGVDLRVALRRFYPPSDDWHRALSPASPAGLRRLMRDLKGSQSIGSLSAAMGVSRFVVSRWLSGHTEPRLSDVLHFVDKSTRRLLDFVAVFVGPERLPSVASPWRQLTLSRELAYEAPWSHAVLRVLELDTYRKLPRHRGGFIAAQLGITRAEEQRCLDLSRAAGQISWRDGRFHVEETRPVDTRRDPERSRQLRAFWSRVAAERIEHGAPGEFAFNLCGVSNADFERIVHLQRDYFRELRDIVARSEPVERVLLVNLHLAPLSEPASGRSMAKATGAGARRSSASRQ